MIQWQELPFVRLLLPFIAGIVLAANGCLASISSVYVLLSVLLCFTLLTYFAWQSLGLNGRRLNTFCLFLGMLLMGLLSWKVHLPGQAKDHLVKQAQTQQYYLIHIDQVKLTRSQKNKQVLLTILGIGSRPGQWEAASGKAVAYLPADLYLSPGSCWITKGSWKPIAPAKSPIGFDYQKYMFRQGILAQLQIEAHALCQLQQAPPWRPLRSYFIAFAHKQAAKIKRHFKEDQAGVLAALVLGQKNELNPKIKADYAAVGAMHVLAVSGMHVGIVAYFVHFLLGFLLKEKIEQRILKAMLSILCIWLFALLSGASPSVLRAATMFSIFLLGRQLYRQANIWNVIAASAFIILFFNPLSLFSLGFQFSYLALASIVYFQPILYRQIVWKNRGLDYAWQLTALGIAAQLGTAPLSIYYFHQFPTYFSLSGLVVVPLATIVLVLGILFLLTYPIPFLSAIINSILALLLEAMNKSMEYIAALPASVLSELQISDWTLLLLYLLIIGFAFWLKKPSRGYSLLLVGLIAVLTTVRILEAQQRERQVICYLHQDKKEIVINWILGRGAMTFAADEQALVSIRYLEEQLFRLKGVQEQQRYTLSKNPYFNITDKTILLLQSMPKPEEWQSLPCADIVILNKDIQASECNKIQDLVGQLLVLGPLVSEKTGQLFLSQKPPDMDLFQMRKDGDVLINLKKLSNSQKTTYRF